MREILFRGQTRKFGQKVNMAGEKQPGIWVYGGIFPGTGDYSVIYGGTTENVIEKHVVYSDTVGQFAGFYDSTKWSDLTQEEQQAFLHQPDGWENTPDMWHGKRVFEGDIFKTRVNIGVIRFREDQGIFGFEIWWRGFPDDFASFDDFGKPSFEIIGNIYDHPELLNPDHPEVVE